MLGFADSRAQARQLVSHGHIHVKGKKVNIPSYLVSIGEEITVAPREGSQKLVTERVESHKGQTLPPWLSLDAKKLEAQVTQMPSREDVVLPIQESYIVEFCSR